jgi:hypothetical protein
MEHIYLKKDFTDPLPPEHKTTIAEAADLYLYLIANYNIGIEKYVPCLHDQLKMIRPQ